MNEYDYENNNCYQLCNSLRISNGLKPLPAYHTDENTSADFIFKELEKKAKRKYTVDDFDLVLFYIHNEFLLGTYVNKQIICMTTAGKTRVEFDRLSQYVHSIWSY